MRKDLLAHKDLINSLVLLIISYLFLFSLKLAQFPLIDDDLYFTSVQNLLNGQLKIHTEISPAFLPQLFYSAIFAQFFGLTYPTLIISTIILGGIGVVMFYLFLRNFFDKKISFLGSLLLLVNPIYFTLSRAFMTDIPAITVAIISLLFFSKGIAKNDNRSL